MLTVAEALQFDEFAEATVVAGKAGLKRRISWLHVVGVPDAADWINGGELVLTTPLNIPADPDARCAYLQALADKGVAALVLATGRYIDHIPDYMCAVAERNAFPLIAIPFQARFVDLARAVNQYISQENMTLIERALHIHQVLTQLVLDGGDLERLARTLAELIGQSVSIENERFEALASHNLAVYDEARRYTLSEGRTDPRLVEALETRDMLGQIRRTLRPVHIPQMADVGLEMERILAPIVVHGAIYGFVWIIADDRPLTELDQLAIESGATIAALLLLHQEAIQNAEASVKGGLISQLIQADAAREAVLADQALRYGLDLTASYLLLLVEHVEAKSNRSSQALLQRYHRIDRALTGQSWPVVVGQFAGKVVVLAQSNADTDAIAERIQAACQPHIGRIGVSAIQRGARHVGAAYGQAQDALVIARRLRDPRPVTRFDDLGYMHTLYRAGGASLQTNPFVPVLRRLYDEQQADLFNTLEVYLDAGGNGVQTAERLCIHRSTLNYRLTRIAEICSVDLSDPQARTNLQIALKLLRLFEVPGE
ncbi:MAG: hypothetical protein GYB67_07795 [Chloroflexi bacterium]|nr:hypothetical protein [Chloroflexota bacterium]